MILIVDDREDTRYLLVRTLTFEGYEAVAVSSGAQALAFLTGTRPTLVILDYSMPEMDGLTVLSKMRNDDRLRDIPVIMFSANDGHVREAALQAGVSAYVLKGSLDWAELRREILRLAGPGNKTRTLPAIPEPREKETG